MIFISFAGGIDFTDESQLVMTIDLTIDPPTAASPPPAPTLPLFSRRRRQSGPPVPVQCIDLSVLADSIVEDSESFTVILGSSDRGVTVDSTPLTVTILDNDCELYT